MENKSVFRHCLVNYKSFKKLPYILMESEMCVYVNKNVEMSTDYKMHQIDAKTRCQLQCEFWIVNSILFVTISFIKSVRVCYL